MPGGWWQWWSRKQQLRAIKSSAHSFTYVCMYMCAFVRLSVCMCVSAFSFNFLLIPLFAKLFICGMKSCCQQKEANNSKYQMKSARRRKVLQKRKKKLKHKRHNHNGCPQPAASQQQPTATSHQQHSWHRQWRMRPHSSSATRCKYA